MFFNRVPKISAEALKEALENKEALDLIDVRETDEYAAGHLPGARNVPLSKLDMAAEAFLPDKARRIVVYCHSGGRSDMAARLLIKRGYSQVSNLGGVIHWPYGLVRGK